MFPLTWVVLGGTICIYYITKIKWNHVVVAWRAFQIVSCVSINLATAILLIQHFIFNVIIYLKKRKKERKGHKLHCHCSLKRLFAPYLDPFFVAISLDNPVHVDAGYVDVLFGKSPNIHHLLHLRREAQRWAPPSPVTALISWPWR